MSSAASFYLLATLKSLNVPLQTHRRQTAPRRFISRLTTDVTSCSALNHLLPSEAADEELISVLVPPPTPTPPRHAASIWSEEATPSAKRHVNHDWSSW